MRHIFTIAAVAAGICIGTSYVSQPAPVSPQTAVTTEKPKAEKPKAEKPKAVPQKTILFFSAGWCQSCEKFKSGPLALLRKAGWTDKHIREVTDADQMGRYGITALPTFVLTVDGKEVDRRVGYMDQWAVGKFYKSAEKTSEASWRSALVKIGGCSGVCIHPDGIILTVKHCNIPKRIKVTIDGKTVDAVKLYEPKKEGPVVLALKGDGPFPYLKFAKELPAVGDTVYSLGFPGEVYTFSEVKYLGTGRDGFLITNHVTIPGNSGGPLVNERGEVIGLLSTSTWNSIGKTPMRSHWVPHAAIKGAIEKAHKKAYTSRHAVEVPWSQLLWSAGFAVAMLVFGPFVVVPAVVIGALASLLL